MEPIPSIRIDFPPAGASTTESTEGTESPVSEVQPWDGEALPDAHWSDDGATGDGGGGGRGHVQRLLSWSPPPVLASSSRPSSSTSRAGSARGGRASAGEGGGGYEYDRWEDEGGSEVSAEQTSHLSLHSRQSGVHRGGSLTPEPAPLVLRLPSPSSPTHPSPHTRRPSDRSTRSPRPRSPTHGTASDGSGGSPSPSPSHRTRGSRSPRVAGEAAPSRSPGGRRRQATPRRTHTPAETTRGRAGRGRGVSDAEDRSDGRLDDGSTSGDDSGDDDVDSEWVEQDGPTGANRQWGVPMLQLPPAEGAVDYHAAWYVGEPGIRLQRQLFPPPSGTPMLTLRPPPPSARDRLCLEGARGFDPDPRTKHSLVRPPPHPADDEEDPPQLHPRVAGLRVLEGESDSEAEAPEPEMSDLRRQWIAISERFEQRTARPDDRPPVVFDRSWRSACPPPTSAQSAPQSVKITEDAGERSGVNPTRQVIAIDAVDPPPTPSPAALTLPEELALVRAQRAVGLDEARDLADARRTADPPTPTPPRALTTENGAAVGAEAARIAALEQTVAHLKGLIDPSGRQHPPDDPALAALLQPVGELETAGEEGRRGGGEGAAADAAGRRWRRALNVVRVTTAVPHEQIDAALTLLHARHSGTALVGGAVLDDQLSIDSLSDNDDPASNADVRGRPLEGGSMLGGGRRVTFEADLAEQNAACDRSLQALEAELSES